MHRFLARLKVRDAANLAKRLLIERRVEEALQHATLARKLAVAHLQPEDVEFVLAANALSAAKCNAGEFKAAIEILEPVLPRVGSVLADLPQDRQEVTNNLAVAYISEERLDDAIPLMERVVVDKAETLGRLSPELLGNLQDLAAACDQAGGLRRAEPAIRHMAEIFKELVGAASREYVQTLENLAICLRDAEKDEEAVKLQTRIDELTGRLQQGKNREQLEADAKQAYRDGDFLRAKQLHRALLAATPQIPIPDIVTDVTGDLSDSLAYYASALDDEGLAAENAGNFALAVRRYQSVYEIFSVSSDGHGIRRAQVMSNLGWAYQQWGDLERAKKCYAKAVHLLGPLLETDVAEAIVGNIVSCYGAACGREAPDPMKDGAAAFGIIGQVMGGEESLRGRSLRVRIPQPDPNDDLAEQMRKSIDARIVFYLSGGAVDPARFLHEQLAEMHELLFAREPGRMIPVLLSFVEFCIERGPVEKARALLDRALELSSECLDESPWVAVETLRWEGIFRSKISDDLGAEEALLSALDLAREDSGLEGHLQSIENDLLVVWMRLGREGEEVDSLVDRSIKIGIDSNDAEVLRQIADMLSYRNEWKRAEELYCKALDEQKKNIGIWDPRYVLTAVNFGALLRTQGRNDEALPLFEQAIRAREHEFGRQHQSVARVRIQLALALGGCARWDEAMDEIHRAVEANELFLQSSAAVSSREQLFRIMQQERAALDVLISIAQNAPGAGDTHREIYEAVLKRKGLGLEVLAARRLPTVSERYSDQLELVTELDQISSIISEALVSMQHSKVDLDEAQERKRKLEAKLAAIITEVRFADALRAADATVIRKALEDDCVLLEFAFYKPYNFDGVISKGDPEFQAPRLLGFVISKDAAVMMHDLGNAAEIVACVTEFGRALAGDAADLRHVSINSAGAERAPCNSDALWEAGERVRQAVWDPMMSDVSGVERVIVAPDGILGVLPFDLLPVDADRTLLLDNYVISNLGSGRELIRLAEQTPAASNPATIFCAPDFDLDDSEWDRTVASMAQRESRPAFVRSAVASGLQRVATLPGALKEGEEIHALLPGSSLVTGRDASESAMRQLRSPVVLHIATHGFSIDANDDSPENVEAIFNAGLILAGANAVLAGGEIDPDMGDAILTGEDAATLNLFGTELVVLSACRSGLGQAVPGEGVFGLHRAFYAAGARSVIVSMWKIPDEQTKDLMTAFYREILKGKTRAAALRAAKLLMRERFPDPFYWGSFLCYGDYRAIPHFGSR